MKQSRELEQQHLRQVRRLWKELLAQKIVSTFYPYSLISFFFTSRIKLLFLFFSKHIFCFLFFVFCSLFFYFIKLLPLIAFIFSSIHPSIHHPSIHPSILSSSLSSFHYFTLQDAISAATKKKEEIHPPIHASILSKINLNNNQKAGLIFVPRHGHKVMKKEE